MRKSLDVTHASGMTGGNSRDFAQQRLDVALAWIAAHPDHYVFPLGDKHSPLIKDNLAKASNDPTQVNAWAAKFKGCGFGLSLKKSGLIVMDIDTKPGKSGQKTVDALKAIHKFPATLRARSPSGGFHLVYKGKHVMKANGFGEHVDSPNYIVLPGIGGYKVVNDLPIANAPAWFYDVLGSTGKSADENSIGEEANFEPTYTTEEFTERLKLIPVEYFDDKPNEWTTFMLACTHASTVHDGREAFIEWTIGSAKYADQGDVISARFETNWRNARNRSGPNVAKVGTFNATLEKFGHADKVIDPNVTTPEEDFDVQAPPQEPKQLSASERIAKMEKIKKLLHKTTKRGATVEEAKSAKAKAEQMMTEYGIKTEELKPPPKAKRTTLNDMLHNWVYIKQQKTFVRRADGFMLDISAFNNAHQYLMRATMFGTVAPSDYVFAMQPGEGMEMFDSFCFAPGEPDRVGGNYNQWVKPDIEPAEGDTKIWDEHLLYLFPDETERNHVLNWCAWVYRFPAQHPKHALLIHGEHQGTGKSVIANALRRLLGNSTSISQKTLTDLNHNGWAVRTKLLLIEEIRAAYGGNKKIEAELHALISEDIVHVDIKNKNDFDMANVMAVLANSNRKDALAMDNTDRRYLVVSTDKPGHRLKPRDDAYYQQLYGKNGVGGILNDPVALAAIAHQLLHRHLGTYTAQGRAPYTDAKKVMTEAGRSPLEQWMTGDGRDSPPLSYSFVTVDEIIKALPTDIERGHKGGGLRQSIADILERPPFNGENLDKVRMGGRNAAKPRLWAINKRSTEPLKGKLSPKRIAEMYLAERRLPSPAEIEEAKKAALLARVEFKAFDLENQGATP